MGFVRWLVRFQEFMGWTPLIVILAVGAWIFFGALDPRVGPDRLGLLLDLPVFTAYALVSSGVSYLIWRRWSKRLTSDQLEKLWAGVMGGHRGPMTIFVTNAVFYLATLILVFSFFWPAR